MTSCSRRTEPSSQRSPSSRYSHLADRATQTSGTDSLRDHRSVLCMKGMANGCLTQYWEPPLPLFFSPSHHSSPSNSTSSLWVRTDVQIWDQTSTSFTELDWLYWLSMVKLGVSIAKVSYLPMQLLRPSWNRPHI
eukprot:2371368-Rhodomonas_salina.4